MIFEVNFIAVIVAAILAIALGFVWYHETVFGKIWRDAHHCDQNCQESALKLVAGFLNTLVVAWVFSALLNFFGVHTVIGSVTTAFWAWLGLIATTQFSGVIWAKKPLKCYFVDAGFFLGMMLVIAVVHGLFS